MKKMNALIILTPLVICFPFFQGCATKPMISFKIENGLPESKLVNYNDSFDRFREDMWDRVGWMHSEPVRANFRQANMFIKDGKLRIETQKGSFSKGGCPQDMSLGGILIFR